jgi:hypothetical protein
MDLALLSDSALEQPGSLVPTLSFRVALSSLMDLLDPLHRRATAQPQRDLLLQLQLVLLVANVESAWWQLLAQA